MRILVTRPAPDNARTAAALRDLGHEALLAPLLRVEGVADADLGEGPFSAILMTSANAARAIAAHVRNGELTATPVLAVGSRTRAAALTAGFTRVEAATGDATALAAMAARDLERAGTILYLAGEDRAADLEGVLAAQGFGVRTVVVYRAVLESTLPSAARDALAAGSVDGALHYSRRTAVAFLAAIEASGLLSAGLALPHGCLSEQIADVLRAAGAPRIAVAASPREAALLTALLGRIGGDG